ncbi:MAG: hypothetical protein EZS28_000671 [Streblomastix strix]|uniref:Uncharacterized protein n=1 Tax=Streblomastix strix TaxID=222440 RepID=A0A5J4XAG8_9EUKA|nr:MAG: hypothetical protein EZS28_000671 [Streblomastix strix]
MHRVNIAGKDYIKKFWYNKQAFRESATFNPYDQSGGMLRTPVTKLGDDVYAVQMNPETCACKTSLQVAYFVLDSAKYWYLNFIYNFMYKCFDMNKLHFVEGDTDSAY